MQYLRNVREYWTPVLKDSAFLQRGVLTPEEFVKAGDHLILCCPSWKWSSGDERGICSFLPKDKQFLTTMQVPCRTRVSSHMNKFDVIEKTVEKDWNETTINEVFDQNTENLKCVSIVENKNEDMEDMLFDEQTIQFSTVPCRRYDISITYDKYYQTPKCWLQGFNENGELLNAKEMLMDIVRDYADKTVTIELHPHLFSPHLYIHPCRHSIVMKNMLNIILSKGSIPKIEMYMFLFIKFIQSVIPTIEYDYTMDIEL